MKPATRSALIFCSGTVALNRLVTNPTYPGIVTDYKKTFARAQDMKPNVLLAPPSVGEPPRYALDAVVVLDASGHRAARAALSCGPVVRRRGADHALRARRAFLLRL